MQWANSTAISDIRQIVSDTQTAAPTWTDNEIQKYIKEAHTWMWAPLPRQLRVLTINVSTLSSQFAASQYTVSASLSVSPVDIIDITLLDAPNGKPVTMIPRALRQVPASGWYTSTDSLASTGALPSSTLYLPIEALRRYPGGQLVLRVRTRDLVETTPTDGSTVDDVYYWGVVYRAASRCYQRLFVDRVTYEKWLQLNATEAASPSDLLNTFRSLNDEAREYRTLFVQRESR